MKKACCVEHFQVSLATVHEKKEKEMGPIFNAQLTAPQTAQIHLTSCLLSLVEHHLDIDLFSSDSSRNIKELTRLPLNFGGCCCCLNPYKMKSDAEKNTAKRIQSLSLQLKTFKKT